MVVVYTHTLSPRLQYILIFLSDYFQQPFTATTDKEAFINAEGARINYSDTRFGVEELHIQPVSLLFEKDIHPLTIECFEINGFKAFFRTEDDDLGFDVFSAIFYLLSRYEEYLPHQKDSYGRYAHQNSVAYQNNFLNQPLINTWLKYFQSKLPNSKLKTTDFTFLPTYDIDIAWSYKNKGTLRNVGGLARSLLKGNLSEAKQRQNVLLDKERDPYDSYDWMDDLHKKHSLSPIYFFHVGKEAGKYDKNIPPDNKDFQLLVKGVASKYKTGLHPSWQSGDEPQLLLEEKERLESLAAQKVTASRQHYIRFNLPHTFRELISVSIKEDYSMGYGSINGFRASITTPFYWYDLKKEEQTNLLLFPFCFMDASSFYEQKQTPKETFDELMHYYKVVKEVNGTLITIWHNNFLGTDPSFKGWREVYEQFIQSIT